MALSKRRVVIYSRVSTSKQEVTMQLCECKDFCKRAGWNVVDVVTDQASGAKRRRPGLEKALGLCRLRKVDVLVVWKLDRLSRSLADLLNTAEELKSFGVNLVSLHDQVDTTTPAGKALFQLVGVFAEFERGIIRERVMAGLDNARSKGRVLGRPKADPEKVAHAQALMRKGNSLNKSAERRHLGRHAFPCPKTIRTMKLYFFFFFVVPNIISSKVFAAGLSKVP